MRPHEMRPGTPRMTASTSALRSSRRAASSLAPSPEYERSTPYMTTSIVHIRCDQRAPKILISRSVADGHSFVLHLRATPRSFPCQGHGPASTAVMTDPLPTETARFPVEE